MPSATPPSHKWHGHHRRRRLCNLQEPFARQIRGGSDPPAGQGWLQTTTIEGTKGIDAWVKANEPSLLVEFGVPTTHVFVGFVKRFIDAAASTAASASSGEVVKFHMSRPPDIAGPAPANAFANVYIGLNDPASKGILRQPADPDTGSSPSATFPWLRTL